MRQQYRQGGTFGLIQVTYNPCIVLFFVEMILSIHRFIRGFVLSLALSLHFRKS